MEDESLDRELNDELLTFAYRMIGSTLEAERALDGVLTPGQSDRVALYRLLATDCMRTCEGSRERSLPAHTMTATEASAWLEPFPDDLYQRAAGAGETRFSERESISLYFILALQSLPPLKRAPLVLADVMGWTADDIGEVLDTGSAEVEDRLAEAHVVFARSYMRELGQHEPPPDGQAFSFVMKYIHRWETANADGLMSLFSDEAVLQEAPTGSYYEGRDAIAQYIASQPFDGDAAGRWRLLPTRANGQMAFGVYIQNKARRSYQAHSIQVLHFSGDVVCEAFSFVFPKLFPLFGMLTEVPAQG
jgi:RNA polymerase sigma-70 factor (ECF subfamily)